MPNIEHTLRKPHDKNSRVALTWAPVGKRKRGRPRTTSRKSVVVEREQLVWQTWSEAQAVASDRGG